MRRIGSAIVILAFSLPVFAEQWQVVTEPVGYAGVSERAVAVVKNEAGNTLKVYTDEAGVVRGMFAIRSGLIRLSDKMCPTYRIDERQPEVVHLGENACELEPDRAHFILGRELNGQIHSDALHRLINGDAVVFSYQLSELGYQQTSFSLSRSKYAVRGAIGRNIPIDKE